MIDSGQLAAKASTTGLSVASKTTLVVVTTGPATLFVTCHDQLVPRLSGSKLSHEIVVPTGAIELRAHGEAIKYSIDA